MAGFLYFIPSLQGVTRTGLVTAGLAELFPDCVPAVRGCERGPGGSGIVCVAPRIEELGGIAPKHGYFPATQTWLQAPSKTHWIGYETAALPRPHDLVRPEMLAGYPVTLEDGNDWLVPVARSIPRGSILPQRMSLGPNGEIVWDALPRFAAFSELAEEAWLDWRRANGWLTEGEQANTMTIERARDIAIAALAMNYRVGVAELAILQVLTTQNMIDVLDAMLDIPALRAAARRAAEQKKKDSPTTIPGGCNSGDGSAAG